MSNEKNHENTATLIEYSVDVFVSNDRPPHALDYSTS